MTAQLQTRTLASAELLRFSQLLRQRRNLLSIKQGDLAKQVGYEKQTSVCTWEKGTAVPPSGKLRDLIRKLQLDSHPEEKARFIYSWQDARLNLDAPLKELMEEIKNVEISPRASEPNGFTLEEIIQRESADTNIREIWILAAETLEGHKIGLAQFAATVQHAEVKFCLEDKYAVARTAATIAKFFSNTADESLRHTVSAKIFFAEIKPSALVGFLSQSLTVHHYADRSIRIYSGLPFAQTLQDRVQELPASKVERQWAEVKKCVGDFRPLMELAPAPTTDARHDFAEVKLMSQTAPADEFVAAT